MEHLTSAGPAAPGEPGPAVSARAANARRDRPPAGQADKNAGWVIISQLMAGMAVYGGLGRLVGQWTGAARITTLVGVLVGLVLALALIIYRYGRS